MFVGEIPPRGAKFSAPGPAHYSCWMSKLLHALKIWTFRKQLSLIVITQEEEAIKELSVFAIQVYDKPWFSASHAIEAPRRNLNILKSLFQLSYKAISFATSQHLYSFSEELFSCFQLF